MNQRFLKGAMILSLSMFLTKILGIIYVIPFKALVGSQGPTLSSYAYTIYSLFISLSTLGIPVGMAKFVSKYQAQHEYDTARRAFKYSVIGMIIFGFLGFLAMYHLAPIYVHHILNNAASLLKTKAEQEALLNDGPDIIHMIQVCSIALTVIPVMSIIRGFFQGNRNMAPTSISQLVEQIVRILIILGGSFFIIKVQHHSYQEAVSISVFAAFLAGIASLIVLLYFWYWEVPGYDQKLAECPPHPKRKPSRLFIEILGCSIPFALLGLATSLYQNIDTLHFHQLLTKSGLAVKTQKVYYGMYITELAKMIMIPVSFALAFGQPLVPELTNYHQQKKNRAVGRTIRLALRLTLVITLPAVIGISLLADDVYLLLYPSTKSINQLGGNLFAIGAWLGIFYALYSIICSILQGLNLQRKGIYYLVFSLIIKYISNFLFVPLFGINGFIYSTILAYLSWIILSLLQIKKHSLLQFNQILCDCFPILCSSLVMGIAVSYLKHLLKTLSLGQKIQALIELGSCALLGAIIYFATYYLFMLLSKTVRKNIKSNKTKVAR